MRYLKQTGLFTLFILWAASIAFSQSTSQESKPAGSVSGRVLLGEQPASGVSVALTQRRVPGLINSPLIQAVTDAQGYFHLTNVAAGTYMIAPLAPGFNIPSENSLLEERSITIDEGEAIEDVNFVIKRGGVITGRITNENHEPLIETRVTLFVITERGRAQIYPIFQPFMNSTDDRGVYRFYGLPAGRYKISVGELSEESTILSSRQKSPYQRTFYPDAMDEAKAEIIEVSEGGETTNIDISVSSKIKTYAVTGRITYAVTGKPVSNISYGYSTVSNQGQGGEISMGISGYTSNRTNSRGEFRIEGIGPGRYALYLTKSQSGELYAEPVVFEVKDADVNNLEMKAKSGISLSGVAVLEGTTNPEVLHALSQVYLSVQISPSAPDGYGKGLQVSSNGAFRFSGLRPGKAQITGYSLPGSKKLRLMRVEQNGVEVKDGIDMKEGEQITNVRVVFAYGTARIRGQIKIENGEVPADSRFMVMLKRIEGTGPGSATLAQVDERRRFMAENLVAGEYEVTVQPGYYQPASGTRLVQTKKTVTVTDGAETQVDFIFDLGEKKDR